MFLVDMSGNGSSPEVLVAGSKEQKDACITIISVCIDRYQSSVLLVVAYESVLDQIAVLIEVLIVSDDLNMTGQDCLAGRLDAIHPRP